MTSTRQQTAGLLLMAAGLALAVVSALADTLDIGEQGFGWKQILGVAVGAAAAVIGAALVLRARPERPRPVGP